MSLRFIRFWGSWGLLVTTAVGVSAQTSYELLFVADRGTQSVHRFDPMTGTHLGEIGKGFLSDARDVTVDASRGEINVFEGNGRIVRFDYSTGLYKGGWNVMPNAAGFHRAQNGEYLAWSATMLTRYSAAGVSLASYAAAAGFNIRGADVAANGGAGFLYIGMRDPANSSNRSTMRWNLANGSNDLNQLWFADRLNFRSNLALNTYESFGDRWIELDISSSAGLSFTNPVNLTTTALRLGQPSWGHSYPGTRGIGYVPARNAANTGGLVIRYDADTGTLRGTFGEGRLQDPVGSATVLAPEPGTMIALGLGLAGLVAKRRRRKN